MLGTRIAALRREAGLSQAELAQRLQVSPSALGMYEQERREPSMQTLVKLSRELGVTTDYLLTGTPAEKERAEAEAKALDLDCVSPYGAAIHREPRLGDFIVPNSEDPAAAFDFVANQIIPILET